MLRCLTSTLLYQFKDVRSKTILEKLAKAKIKAGTHPDEVDMEELARESGLAPSNSASMESFVQEKETVLGMLQEQRVRRIARREAFLEWQAGQREKGAAHRLLRQSRKAEKYKQRHYHAVSGRMVPVLAAKSDSSSTTECRNQRSNHTNSDYRLGNADAHRWEKLHLVLGKK